MSFTYFARFLKHFKVFDELVVPGSLLLETIARDALRFTGLAVLGTVAFSDPCEGISPSYRSCIAWEAEF